MEEGGRGRERGRKKESGRGKCRLADGDGEEAHRSPGAPPRSRAIVTPFSPANPSPLPTSVATPLRVSHGPALRGPAPKRRGALPALGASLTPTAKPAKERSPSNTRITHLDVGINHPRGPTSCTGLASHSRSSSLILTSERVSLREAACCLAGILTGPRRRRTGGRCTKDAARAGASLPLLTETEATQVAR